MSVISSNTGLVYFGMTTHNEIKISRMTHFIQKQELRKSFSCRYLSIISRILHTLCCPHLDRFDIISHCESPPINYLVPEGHSLINAVVYSKNKCLREMTSEGETREDQGLTLKNWRRFSLYINLDCAA